MAANPQIDTTADMRSSFARFMATAGLEMRWPILFSGYGSSHVFEPMGQVFVRPNEQYVGGLAVPNEDAQSFVFDATTLFQRDKFSGYDRIEGGTRANVGMRYFGQLRQRLGNGRPVRPVLSACGPEFLAAPDLVNAGAESGLETTKSDYVGMVVISPNGFSSSVSGRFDEQTFAVRRAVVKAALANFGPLSLSAQYAYIQAQPLYGFNYDRNELTLSGSTKINKYWRVFGPAPATCGSER